MKNLLIVILSFISMSCTDLVIDNGYDSLVLNESDLSMESNLEDREEWKPDVKIVNFSCSATNDEGVTLLIEGEKYALNVELEFERGLNWPATVAFYLASDTLLHVDTRPNHLYTDWLTPLASSNWLWCGAPYKCDVVESPVFLGSNQLSINGNFWGPTKRPYGEYYVLAVVDQKREVNERNEVNNLAWIKLNVSPKRQSINCNKADIKV